MGYSKIPEGLGSSLFTKFYTFLKNVLRCGSGLSGECLTDNDHVWVGMDISPHMLGENKYCWPL